MEVLEKHESDRGLKEYDHKSVIFTDDLIQEANKNANKFSLTDIALLNLQFAQGLPGSEDLNIRKMLHILDRLASDVQKFTLKYRNQFQMNPEKNQGTWGKFKMMCLATVVQREWKITYRPELVEGDFDARDSRSQFIHGPLTGFGGTCTNMPVLYIAIGRRLGYPLSLVHAVAHSFVRWEGEGERFNIEATCYGFNSHSDDHYRKWPKLVEPEEERLGYFLKSLTNREVLAEFFGLRSTVLADHMFTDEACMCAGQAFKYDKFWGGRFALKTELDAWMNFAVDKYQVNPEHLPARLADDTTRHEAYTKFIMLAKHPEQRRRRRDVTEDYEGFERLIRLHKNKPFEIIKTSL